jgi:hypothetical protein
MHQRIIRQRSNILSDTLIFHTENMPFRAALSRKRFLAQKTSFNIKVLTTLTSFHFARFIRVPETKTP